MPRPTVVLLDVNETLSDLTPLADVLADVGAPRDLAPAWLSGVLRDGISLAVQGTAAPFADIARDVSARLLAPYVDHAASGDAVERLISTFTSLDVHPDVAPGLRGLAEAGTRVVTLSNGAAAVAEGLLDRAGLGGPGDVVERFLSVEDAGVWKPAARAYTWACDELGVAPDEAMLVAVHPWDTDGAARAGLRSAWVDRAGSALGFPAHFVAPTLQVQSLTELAGALDPPA